MNDTTLGIDIAKKKFDAVLLKDNKSNHKEFSNDKKGFEKLFSWLQKNESLQAHICLEATGIYGEDLAYFLYENHMRVSVVNPVCIKAFAKSELKRNKTDKADAQTIARFCRVYRPSLWQPPLPELKRLKSLYRCLQRLKEDKVRVSLRLERTRKEDTIEYQTWLNLLASIEKQITLIEGRMEKLLNSYPSISEKVSLLESIPGISRVTAFALLAELPDISGFSSAKQLVAYARLSPKHKLSGTSVKGKARLSKVGNPILRKALYMPAVVAKNHNPVLKKFAERLLENHKHPMAIIAAVMRKLLHVVYGVLKSEKPFDLHLST